MPKVSVVVPAWRAHETIGRTLAALGRQNLDEPFEVIVSVDDPDPATLEAIERAGTAAVVVKGPLGRAEGYSGTRNRGVDASSGEVLAFTDADCEPAPDWLRNALSCLEHADLVQGTVEPTPRRPLGPFDRTIVVLGYSGRYETANLIATRALYQRVGGFEPWLPGGERVFGEDAWFGWRARRLGARFAFCAEAVVYHEIFERRPVQFVSQHLDRRYFPMLTRRVPELREAAFYRRYFLDRRTAAFDAAAAGVIVAALRRSPLPLAATLPYLWRLRREGASPIDPGSLKIAATRVAADAVGLAALAWGSARARTLVI